MADVKPNPTVTAHEAKPSRERLAPALPDRSLGAEGQPASHLQRIRALARRSMPSQHVATLLSVSLGGLLGANARYLVGLWAVNLWGSGFPIGTLIVNGVGSFLLGFYLTLTTERFIGRRPTRLFVATGFLGAFTTFSTFSYELASMILSGAPLLALGYVIASLAIGLAAVVAGVLCAHAL